jgi:hypothetical protein
MKNARIHLIYLAIISFLVYQYWTKTQALDEAVGSIEQFDKLSKVNIKVIDAELIMTKNIIDKQAMAYPTPFAISFQNKMTNSITVLNSVKNWLDKQKLDFTNFSGGFDKKDSSILANLLSLKANRQFFSDVKIKEIRDSLTSFQSVLNNIADKKVLDELQKVYSVPMLLKNENYWRKLKAKTNADVLAQITYIHNQMVLDEVYYLNYLCGYGACGDVEVKFDQFKVAITAQKSALIEGETFKADIYLAQFSSNPGPDVSILVNDKAIPIQDGVAHFENMEQIPGLKTVTATAIVKNPLTGQISHYLGSFEYNVLPKCSRDCK